jgi:hypothetical protein
MCEKCRVLFPQDLILAMNLPGAAYFSGKANRNQGTALYQDAEHIRRTEAAVQEARLANAVLQTLIVVALADQEFDEAETRILQDYNEVLAGWKMQRGELLCRRCAIWSLPHKRTLAIWRLIFSLCPLASTSSWKEPTSWLIPAANWSPAKPRFFVPCVPGQPLPNQSTTPPWKLPNDAGGPS